MGTCFPLKSVGGSDKIMDDASNW